MYAEMKSLVEAIWNAIKTGKSDAARLGSLAVQCIHNGTLYNVQRDTNGKIMLDENGETVKVKFEFGEQIHIALKDVYLALDQQHGIETDGVKYGEMNRVLLSAARYAGDRLGFKWKPEAPETTKFKLDSSLSAQDIASVLKDKIDAAKLAELVELLA